MADCWSTTRNWLGIPITLILYNPPNPDLLQYLSTTSSAMIRRKPESPSEDQGGVVSLAIQVINQAIYLRRQIDRVQPPLPPSSPNRSISTLWSPLRYAQSALERCSLVSYSRTASQLRIRIAQALHTPSVASDLRTRRRAGEAASHLSRTYTAVWGSLWLVSYDVLLGQVAAMALSGLVTSGKLDPVRTWTYRVLYYEPLTLLTWLEQWPVGLKLNAPLATFLGDMARALFLVFDELVLAPTLAGGAGVSKCTKLVEVLIASTQYGGITLGLALGTDLLTLLTLHLRLLHTVLATLTRGLFQSLVALFLLFQARRRNPLRGGRIDRANQYELDHTLLGTILFTLLLFLTPTIGVYYLCAAVPLAFVVLVTALLDSARATINFFPLLGLLLRIKDPARVPGAISLVSAQHPTTRGFAMVYRLMSVPVSVSQLFEEYTNYQLAPLWAVPPSWWDLVCARTVSAACANVPIPFLQNDDGL